MYKPVMSRQACKDLDNLKRAGAVYAKKANQYVVIVSKDPYQNPPPYKKLIGDLDGYYSRRINDQHRFVYEVLPNSNNLTDESGIPYKGIVRILSMWTHYE